MSVLCLIIGLGLPAFIFAWLARDVEPDNVQCRCGRTKARGIIFVDSVDRNRSIDALTENCDICRARKREDHHDAKHESTVS